MDKLRIFIDYSTIIYSFQEVKHRIYLNMDAFMMRYAKKSEEVSYSKKIFSY